MAHKAGAKEAWEQLTKDLFKQKEFAGAISHNVDGVERNIKKKYNDVLIEMRQEMATGNKSGLEGDHSYAYRLAEGIDNDIAEAEDKKTDRTNQSKRTFDIHKLLCSYCAVVWQQYKFLLQCEISVASASQHAADK
mmetsp:Transcript_80604/g.158196  ORF Transcript_80604/g.158196 Transcript_80604/m.158196 type:complete len:136 (+) Transcript_80604:184-591(+)